MRWAACCGLLLLGSCSLVDSVMSGPEVSVEDPTSLIGSTRFAAPPERHHEPWWAHTPAVFLFCFHDFFLARKYSLAQQRSLSLCTTSFYSTSLPDCQAYSGGVCASGGQKILVPDGAEKGLIAHYTFDDARATDTSGHGNHAKVVPMAGPGHGPVGAGAWFDGIKAMEVPHIPKMDSPDLTIAFWIYLLEDSTNSYRTIVRKAKVQQDMTPSIMLLPNDRRLHIRLSTNAASANNAVVGFDSTAVIPLRRWTHVACVLKGGAALALYINGVKDCPMPGQMRRHTGCSPGGATYAWDEGDVKHNQGPLYVGADPFMPGANMFLDALKIFDTALPEKEVQLEANDALGLAGVRFLRLGCQNCTREALQAACAEADEYHPCFCHELMGGGLVQARAMGWLRGPSQHWAFHAEAQARFTAPLRMLPALWRSFSCDPRKSALSH